MATKLVSRIGGSWYVWLFPLLAILLSGILFYNAYADRGPLIFIEMTDAGGIQAEKTKVRYHGVTVGSVNDVRLDKDGQIDVEVRLNHDGARFAVKGTTFTLVKPKASFQGVSGLNTILEGLYIEVYPAKDPGAKSVHFRAGEVPIETKENMSEYIVEAEDSESISTGDSITFRGVHVGTILSKTLIKAGTRVQIRIAIQNADTYLIRENTVFWRKVGVQANLGWLGAKIKMNSLESIVNGGLQFRTPDPAGAKAKAGRVYGLVSAPPKDFEKWQPMLQ